MSDWSILVIDDLYQQIYNVEVARFICTYKFWGTSYISVVSMFVAGQTGVGVLRCVCLTSAGMLGILQ